MALSEKTPVEDVIHTNLKIMARIEPDEAVTDLLPGVEVPHVHFLDKVGARNKADNALLKAEGRRDYRRTKLEATLVPFGLKVAAHFGNRTDPGYVRILKQSPSDTANAPERDLPTLIAVIVAAINHKDTPAELKKAGAGLLATADAYLKESAASISAAQALAEAMEEVAKGRIKCLDAHASLRGSLQARFPRQPKVVAAYFPRTSKKAVAVKALAVPA